MHVGYVECVDEWLQVIDDLECTQVGEVDYVDESLEVIEYVDCMHVDDVDCSCTFYATLT